MKCVSKAGLVIVYDARNLQTFLKTDVLLTTYSDREFHVILHQQRIKDALWARGLKQLHIDIARLHIYMSQVFSQSV